MKYENVSSSAAAAEPGFRREEVVRLILQALNDFGYKDSVNVLQRESGFQLENVWVSLLRSSIMDGKWSEAEHAVLNLCGSSGNSSTVDDTSRRLLFFIRKQRYIELLLQRQKKDALHLLRTDIAALNCDSSDLHELTSWLMDSVPENVAAIGSSDSIPEKRLALCEQLQQFIHKSQVLPSHRLEALLQQAVNHQISSCLYHNPGAEDLSLYVDHMCDRESFPRRTSHVLDGHTDEVWYISFSHSGNRLASASKDHSCIIWSTEDWEKLFVLSGHDDAISFLAWSPDDSMMITCGNDHKVKLWNTTTGACQRTFSRHSDAVTSCAWLPDGQKFVSSSLDKTIYYWNVDGTLLYRWMGARITDLAINHLGTQMIAICHERKIRIYDLELKMEQFIQEEHSITSLSLSKDSKCVLVNISAEEIHLWNLETRTLVGKFQGQKQGRFVIRSCFGGANENFIISGSEDCNVYIWNRQQSKLLEALPGHSGTVNSVTWNPENANMFASASDDCTIRIWEP